MLLSPLINTEKVRGGWYGEDKILVGDNEHNDIGIELAKEIAGVVCRHLNDKE